MTPASNCQATGSLLPLVRVYLLETNSVLDLGVLIHVRLARPAAWAGQAATRLCAR
jgi:hypothetical protein